MGNHYAVETLFLATGTLLVAAQLFGAWMVRWKQPAVIGEILAGVVLGPTVLGALWPAAERALFPSDGPLPAVLGGITQIGLCLFLLVAGTEVDLIRVIRLREKVALVSIGGILAPFAGGFAACWYAPQFFGLTGRIPPLLLAAIVACALSITALPVIVKILRDLGLQHTEIGTVIIASAVCNDLIGWFVFGVLLGLLEPSAVAPRHPADMFILTLLFVIFTLTAVRWLINRALARIAAHPRRQRALLGSIAGGTLLFAYGASRLGVHPNFGAFLLGIAIGDCTHLSHKIRHSLDQFVSQVLAPLFFAAIGLTVNFALYFEWRLTLAVIALASVTKLIGCGIGARMSGFDRRHCAAIGWGMNARGAVEIVLAVLAREAGAITNELFVALVIMALFTSMVSGGVMRHMMGEAQPACR